ncbi:MAG: hydantoinase/carbamoylase family amidase [Pseudomonadota bacterium]|nr:hydantoinase/carbamoylase family amidase [Pseudomonadota bacterium]
MPQVNVKRVLGDLYTLREIGKYKTGVHRPTLSDDDMKTRYWLREQLSKLRYDVHIDGVANVIGYSPTPGKKLLCGSHLETQNHAGWLDGALGIVYALEAARCLTESNKADVGVDVMAFADEEGHFGELIGSNSLVGNLTDEMLDKARNRTDGTPLREALARAGLATAPRTLIDRERYVGMFEAHIEQGSSLEVDGNRIGIVTSIVGNWRFQITATGMQNHAGTTRMDMRKDAGAALMRIYNQIEQQFPLHAGSRTVWTIGKITLYPGAPSIVPGTAEMLFQFRDADENTLKHLKSLLEKIIQAEDNNGPCEISIEMRGRSNPALMDERMQCEIEAAAETSASGKHVRMPSGAGHDARTIAQVLPAAMMFIPSIGGISHHYAENTSDEDIALGAQVYVDAVTRILAPQA